MKPANIMVDKSDQVKLIDFGASKQLNAQKGGATTSTAVSYTNGYAPREQMEQNYEKFGPWTDIYALGATLYNLLTNKRPPLPTDIDDDMSYDKHVALPFPTNVSQQTKDLVLKMMQTNRVKRPQNINEINIQDIAGVGDEETEIIDLPGDRKNDDSNSKHKNTIIMFVFIFIALLYFGGIIYITSNKEYSEPPQVVEGDSLYLCDSVYDDTLVVVDSIMMIP